jgi:hypothetical protein
MWMIPPNSIPLAEFRNVSVPNPKIMELWQIGTFRVMRSMWR